MNHATTLSRAYDLVMQHQPDVAVLDVQMPNGNGIHVARRLRAAGLALGILTLTAFDEPPYIKASLEAGANGYVLKSLDAEAIIEAVRAVYEGKMAFSEGLAMPSPGDAPEDKSAIVLTEREHEILQLVARGLMKGDWLPDVDQ